jgi:GDP-4-dehydro-6-deoxy-D-mannose reductase
MPRLWMTGANGFVGRYVQIAAQSLGCEVSVLPPATDIRDGDGVIRSLRETSPDWVIHLAAMSFVPDAIRDPALCREVNVEGTRNLLTALLETEFNGRFLYVSSADVYGTVEMAHLPIDESAPLRPSNPYAQSKLDAESICREAINSNFDVLIARPFNHIGPGQRTDFFVPTVAVQIKRIAKGVSPPVLNLGNLSSTRDFLDVRDVADAYLALLASGQNNETYNVASGIERSLTSVVADLLSIAACEAAIEVDRSRLRNTPATRAVGNANLLRSATNWQPKISWGTTLTSILQDLE